MPVKLPDETSLGARPLPSLNAGIARYSPDTSGEEALGRAEVTLGQTTLRAGQTLDASFEREWERQDRIAAEDAYNKLRSQQLELTIGEKGFTRVRGADAVNGDMLERYPEELKGAATGIYEGLKNDRQRQNFTRLAQVSAIQFKEDLLRHRVKEADVYAAQVYKATIENEVNSATARWQDPEAIKLTELRLKDVIANEGERRGWDAASIKAETFRATSAVHSTVISQAIASNDHVYAKQWFDEHRDAIDPKTAVMVEKAVADAEQKSLFNGYQRELLDARNSGGKLLSLERRIAGDDTLDETRKTALLGRIASRQDILERRHIAEQQHRVNIVSRGITKLQTQAFKGWEIGAEQIAGLTDAAKGTGLEGDVASLVKLSERTVKFRNGTPIQREQMLTDLERKIREHQGADKGSMIELLEAYKSIDKAQNQELRDDPIRYGATKGLIDAVPLDLNKAPHENAAAWRARLEQGTLIANEYGVPRRVLMKEERDALVRVIAGATPAQKAQFMGSLKQALDDDQAYMTVLGQIAPDEPVTAIAGSIATTNRTSISAEMLEGQAMINPPVDPKTGNKPKGKTWPVPVEKKFRDEFASISGTAYGGHAGYMKAVFEGAKALYTARAARMGLLETDDIDSDLWAQAIKDAGGNVVTYNNRPTLVPWNAAEPDAFKAAIERRLENLIASKAIDPYWGMTELRDMPLEAVGEGRYRIPLSNGYLGGVDGKPIELDLNGPTPYFPSGERGQVPQLKDDLIVRDARYGELGLLKRPDGRVSTELSTTVQMGGAWVNVPLLVRGQIAVGALLRGDLPSRQQIDIALRRADERTRGGAFLPKYETREAAEAAARGRTEEEKMRPYR